MLPSISWLLMQGRAFYCCRSTHRDSRGSERSEIQELATRMPDTCKSSVLNTCKQQNVFDFWSVPRFCFMNLSRAEKSPEQGRTFSFVSPTFTVNKTLLEPAEWKQNEWKIFKKKEEILHSQCVGETNTKAAAEILLERLRRKSMSYKPCKCNEITRYVYAPCCSRRMNEKKTATAKAKAKEANSIYQRIMQNYAEKKIK